MPVAALYDIHGNRPALAAVLAEVDARGADVILVGGDVAAGPLPRATLDLLTPRGERVRFIRGNADRGIVAARRQPPPDEAYPWARQERWAAAQLTPAQVELLAGLDATAQLAIPGLGAVLFCHGTPRSDEEILTRISPAERVADALAGVTADLVVCGHTHVQYDRTIAGHRLVNAGSVGMPYEGEPAARWALLGPEVTLMRTPYDVDAAGVEIRAGGYPDADEFVRRFLVSPFSAEEVSARFEARAIASRPGAAKG
jgi:predicted phosphodiesterase